MKGKPTLHLEHGANVKGAQIVYVGGQRPYFWIGDADGHYFGSVELDQLREFVADKRPTPPRSRAGNGHEETSA